MMRSYPDFGNLEVIAVVGLVAALLVYVIRHLSKAIKDLKKELGD